MTPISTEDMTELERMLEEHERARRNRPTMGNLHRFAEVPDERTYTAIRSLIARVKALEGALRRMVDDFGDVCDEGDMEAKQVIGDARAALQGEKT